MQDPEPGTAAANEGHTARVTRREALEGIAGTVGAVLAAGLALPDLADASRPPAAVAPPARVPGAPTSPVGSRAPHAVAAVRSPAGQAVGSSLTPLQHLTGTITPSDLHFERHHAGVPVIDPDTHDLVIHGLVERPMRFSVDDLKRFPPVTRICFVECSGNGRAVWHAPSPGLTPQRTDGMTSNSEWTGVMLSTLFREVGVRDTARWFLAEGGDACLMTRSIPMEKAWDDAMVVWAQNGEPLRPEQGFPLRLLLPGYEGNANVKWVRRLELGTAPWMTRWETSKYTDPLKDDTARIFSLTMDAKSIITSPCVPDTIAPGWRPVTGLAWSGRGRVTRVEVSTDAGRTWVPAPLSEPVLPRAHTRFTLMWNWSGQPTVLLSRAIDETGSVQPTRQALFEARGAGTDYHNNAVRGWRVDSAGQVTFFWET